MNREIHVRFWEGLGVRFPRATHWPPLSARCHHAHLHSESRQGGLRRFSPAQ